MTGEVVNDIDLPVVSILCITDSKNRRTEREQVKFSERYAGRVISAEERRAVNRDGTAEIIKRVIESAAIDGVIKSQIIADRAADDIGRS